MGDEARLGTFSPEFLKQVAYPDNLTIAEEYRRRCTRVRGYYDVRDVIARRIASAPEDICEYYKNNGNSLRGLIIPLLSKDTMGKIEPLVAHLAAGKKFDRAKPVSLDEMIF